MSGNNFRIYGTPENSFLREDDMLMFCHGNFLPLDKEGQPKYIGNIFIEPIDVLEKKLESLVFKAVARNGMARYALKMLASINPGDIVITKIGNNTVEVYLVGEHRLYKAVVPPEKLVKDYKAFEEYCIEVKRIGRIQVDENLYKKLAIPRTITQFKDPEILHRITDKIQELLGKGSHL